MKFMKLKVGDFAEYVGNSDRFLKNGLRYCVSEVDENDNSLPYKIKVDATRERWVKSEELKPTSYKMVRINCADKAEAHKIVNEIIERYRNEKRDWTEEELTEIEAYYKTLLVDCHDKSFVPIFNHASPKCVTLEVYTYGISPVPFFSKGNARLYRTKKVFAKVSSHDVFNERVGRVVCLCKALGKEIPAVIMEKNT